MGPRTPAIFDTNYIVKKRFTTSDPDKGDSWETICKANNFSVAKAGFEASLGEYTGSTIVLQNQSRVIEVAETGLYDSKTRTVPVLKRMR